MCGIAGLFAFDGRFTCEDVEGVLRMLDAQVHRGPDDWGLLLPHNIYCNEQVKQLLEKYDNKHIRIYQPAESVPAVILGSRRLSILDLSARGRMPMSNADETLWLTYNGEIYNSPALRKELSTCYSRTIEWYEQTQDSRNSDVRTVARS